MEYYRYISSNICFLYCHSARFGYGNRVWIDARMESFGLMPIRVIEIQLWCWTLLIEFQHAVPVAG